ncbi:MAG: peptide chain release factor N(5)-glutamine methyltransferase [Litorilituus sp.]|jgi:release factor glutamine methyltransferase|nr:peptide chain release factor N(5)-glutamine methyltransferase [Litorilituus sp.]
MGFGLCFRFYGDNSIKNVISQGQQLLTSGSDSALLDAQILLSFALNKPHSFLFTWPEQLITEQQLTHYITLLTRRYQGEPIAYIIEEKEFWSLPLKVSPATLIPRPDTETLIELVLKLYADNEVKHCLDLGTGTGAIALALAAENPRWHIEAVDFNHDVVSLAKQNALRLGLAHVQLYQSDWFSAVSAEKSFDIIVSNPPYIDEDDENLTQGDVRFEPKSALVAHEQGLADIRYITNNAMKYLVKGGRLFFEHGFEQGQTVRELLLKKGYKTPKTVQDLNGNDRITWAIRP